MTTSTKVLGGVASFVLLSAMGAVGPVLAQGLSESTPEEMAQTMTLNEEELGQSGMLGQMNAMIASNEISNQSAYSAAQMQFNEAQARYKQQVDEYDKQLKDYQAQNQSFEQQTSDFNAARSDYATTSAPPVASTTPPSDVIESSPDARVVAEAPPVVAEQGLALVYPDTTLVHLGSLAQPDIDIAGAPVEDRLGQPVGHFNHMTYADEGRAEAVISLTSRKMIALPEDHLRFDTGRSVVVADLTFDELKRMPGRL